MDQDRGGAAAFAEPVHFIGIGGSGMSGIARILAKRGIRVTGSDSKESATLESLRTDYAIDAYAGHDAFKMAGSGTVVASAAIRGDNVEYAAAGSGQTPLYSRAEFLGLMMDGYAKSVAVSGTHGKTTTSAMIATILEAGDLDPTVVIGGDLASIGGNARLGSGDVFVAEACEAYGSFLSFRSDTAVVTNIEADHLDYYADLEAITASFVKFLSQVRTSAVLNVDDINVRALSIAKQFSAQCVTYATSVDADVVAKHVQARNGGMTYDVTAYGVALGTIELKVPGLHNVSNSLAAIAVGLIYGVNFDAIKRGLASFRGTKRRFEILGTTRDGVTVVDDYAHHPTELTLTLAAAREAFPGRKIIAAFQPHLPSRTRDFMDDFAHSFSDADYVLITEIFLAREAALSGVSGADLAERASQAKGGDVVTYVDDVTVLPTAIRRVIAPGDVLMTLGAGDDIRAVAEQYLKCESELVTQS